MIESTAANRKLVRIRVDGLLGRFDHDLLFDPQWQFLILHGPNGVGKTLLLELLHSAFSGRYIRLARIPFASAQFDFEDKTSIEVTRGDGITDPLRSTIPPSETLPSRSLGMLTWKISVQNREPAIHTMTPAFTNEDRRLLARLERDYALEQIDTDLWLDLRTREELGADEVAERYGVALVHESMPSPLRETLDKYPTHLIETQRLLNASRNYRRRGVPRSEYSTQQPTVVSYAEALSRLLSETLANNSRTSQELDRSFPGRLFQELPETETEEHLRDRYTAQLELRSRLARIAILDSSADLELPERDLEDWERKVLKIYLDDAEAKLRTFQPLLERFELIRAIANERFLFKTLEFDREKGLAFKDEDSDALLDLRHLSSGEQHELVLMYDLLMNVGEHSLVLIDEPEISLHVAWQKSFLDDLDRIASLRPLRFIIATHSPQIVGKRWDRTVELYRVS